MKIVSVMFDRCWCVAGLRGKYAFLRVEMYLVLDFNLFQIEDMSTVQREDT